MSSLSGAQFEADPPTPPAADVEASPRVEPNPREAELLRRARSGDRGAYGQIVILYQDRLFNAMLRLMGDVEEARELTQEAFTRGLSKIDGFRGDAAPYTWLFRIGMNLAITALRKSHRHRVFSLDAGPATGRKSKADRDPSSGMAERVSSDRRVNRKSIAPDQAMENQERDQQVVDALGRLEPDYRAVLVLRDIEGFDYQQMAEVLSVPLGTLKSRLFRARLALRDELQAYLNDRKKR